MKINTAGLIVTLGGALLLGMCAVPEIATEGQVVLAFHGLAFMACGLVISIIGMGERP